MFELCNKNINKEWDDFIATIPAINHDQSSAWGMTIPHLDGWKPFRVIIRKQNAIVCGAQILIKDVPYFGKIGYIEQGPCIKNNTPECLKELIKAIKTVSIRQNLKYLTLDVAYNLQMLPTLLEKEGFAQHSPIIPPKPFIDCTLILDLTQELDAIFAGFKPNRRKSIHQGLKHGIELREGSREDIPLLFQLINETCQRKGMSNYYQKEETLYLMWDNFIGINGVVIHIGEINKEVVCGSLSFTFGDTFRDSVWGWSGKFSNMHVSDVVTWKMIEWAKKKGFRYYDFVNLDAPTARAILAEETITEELKSRKDYGSTFYKMRFGGEVVFYPGAYVFVPNKILRWLYQFFAKSSFLISLLKKIISFARLITRFGEKRVRNYSFLCMYYPALEII